MTEFYTGLASALRVQRRGLRQTVMSAMTMAVAAVPAGSTYAQGYPNRALKMIVPMATGGPADTGARLFASALGESLGQNIVVENRSGASGVVGTEAVINAPADGYTLLFGSSSVFAVNPAVLKGLRFDVRKDIKLIGLIMQTDLVVAARPGIEARGLADVVRMAKAQPGKLSFASSGAGGITHLLAELVGLETGINLLSIHFRGAGPAVIGILAGDADLTASGLVGLSSHIKSGKAIGIGVSSDKRSRLLPELPTFAEQGYPGIVAQNWYGMAVSSRTPADIVLKLDTATSQITSSSGFQAALEKIGMEPLVMNATQSAAFIERELDKWARVATSAKIQLDQ